MSYKRKDLAFEECEQDSGDHTDLTDPEDEHPANEVNLSLSDFLANFAYFFGKAAFESLFNNGDGVLAVVFLTPH